MCSPHSPNPSTGLCKDREKILLYIFIDTNVCVLMNKEIHSWAVAQMCRASGRLQCGGRRCQHRGLEIRVAGKNGTGMMPCTDKQTWGV